LEGAFNLLKFALNPEEGASGRFGSRPPGIPVREFPGIPGNPPPQKFPAGIPGNY